MENPPLGASSDKITARRMLAVNEEELQRIILDIHDGPVQNLFAALAQVNLAQKRRRRGETVAAADYDRLLARLSTLLEATLDEIRNFLGTFRPPDFAQRRLSEIIEGLLMHHEMATGCQVTLAMGKRPCSTSLPVKIALYRICQEALSNAHRHAQASHQWVRLTEEGAHIVMEIRDDGRGFEPPPLTGPEATEREEHIGLRGMRERIALVGGQFELHSAPGAGTRIIVKAPVDE